MLTYIKFVIFFDRNYVYFRNNTQFIMPKNDCKDGKCEVKIPDLTTDESKKDKVDKKDSAKRLR